MSCRTEVAQECSLPPHIKLLTCEYTYLLVSLQVNMGGSVKLITSVEEWQAALSQSKGFGGKAFIIDFTASW